MEHTYDYLASLTEFSISVMHFLTRLASAHASKFKRNNDSIFELLKLKRHLVNSSLMKSLRCDSLDTGQSLEPEPPQSIVGMRV